MILVSFSAADAEQQSDATSEAADTIRLQVAVYPGVDAATLEASKATAGKLLESAGILVEWVAGDHSDAVDAHGPRERVPVVVRLLPTQKASQPDVSGEVAVDARTHTPTVLVYVHRIRAVVRTIHAGTAGRANPALATITPGALIGLTIAHEVGHILGLPHAPSGIMKSNPGPGELLRLRASRLTFLPRETVQMRRMMAGRVAPKSR